MILVIVTWLVASFAPIGVLLDRSIESVAVWTIVFNAAVGLVRLLSISKELEPYTNRLQLIVSLAAIALTGVLLGQTIDNPWSITTAVALALSMPISHWAYVTPKENIGIFKEFIYIISMIAVSFSFLISLIGFDNLQMSKVTSENFSEFIIWILFFIGLIFNIIYIVIKNNPQRRLRQVLYTSITSFAAILLIAVMVYNEKYVGFSISLTILTIMLVLVHWNVFNGTYEKSATYESYRAIRLQF